MSLPHSSPKSSARFDWLLAICCTVMSLGEIWRVKSIFRFWTGDLLPYSDWYETILSLGRWRAIHGNFSSYNPPYVYVLALFSNLSFWHGPFTIIKLANTPFILASAVIFYVICKDLGCSPRRSFLAAWVLVTAPEIIANAFVWGQSDIMETTFVLLLAFLLIRKRPFAAMVVGGIALCFKLQAIFIGPAILAMLLAGEISWVAVLGVPVGYVLMMLPAFAAGRPLGTLFGSYSGQVQVPEPITLLAANYYEFLMPWTHYANYGPRLWWAVRIGVCFGAAMSLLLVRFLVQHKPLVRGQRVLFALALSALTVPFVLPKMHERYFYIGDTLALLLGVLRPRLFVPAILLQITAILAYAPYVIGFKQPVTYFILPCLMLTIALVLIYREFLRDPYRAATEERDRAQGIPSAVSVAQ